MNANKTIINMLLQPIASGSQRKVFNMYYCDNKVIKVSQNSRLQNSIEYDIWNSFCCTEEGKKWLAECFELSANHKVLIQERLSIINDVNDPRLPKQVPRCFTDLKVQNWGVAADGTVKCCDYGNTLLLQEQPWRLKKAEWWSYEFAR